MKLWNGDCLELMKDIPDKSIDMVLTDTPYGTTACKWDTAIPFDEYIEIDGKLLTFKEVCRIYKKYWVSITDMRYDFEGLKKEGIWQILNRIVKDRGAICLFGAEPFSSKMRISNIENYKYDWVWQKDKPTNHLNAKKQPMRRNELISVFYKKQCLYQPQLLRKDPKNIRPPTTKRKQAENYGKMTAESKRSIPMNMSYPNETLEFRGCFGYKGKSLHPTQKPVALLEYLIKTYTLENETVLDFTMGSGSTGVACKNLNREFIGIEKDENYFNLAKNRINRS